MQTTLTFHIEKAYPWNFVEEHENISELHASHLFVIVDSVNVIAQILQLDDDLVIIIND